MTVKKRQDGYQVYVGKGNRRWRQTVPTKEQGLILEAEWRTSLLQGNEPMTLTTENEEQAQYTLGELADRTFNLYWAGTKGAKTAKSNSDDVVRLIGADRLLTSIDQVVVNDLLAAFKTRGLSPASINRKMAALGKILTLALEEGLIIKRPRMPRQKEANQRTKCFSSEELAALFGHMESKGHKDVADLCRWLLETGMRVSEARAITWENAGLASTNGSARIFKNKADEPRSIPLTKEAHRVLSSRKEYLSHMEGATALDARPWEAVTQSRLTHVWNQARTALEYTDPDCVPHSLRHTCASRLARSGVDLLSIQKWLGHRTLTMTLRYSHLSQHQLEDAKQALENWDG